MSLAAAAALAFLAILAMAAAAPASPANPIATAWPSRQPRPTLTPPRSAINFTPVSDQTADLSGKRYGEVLLVTAGDAGPQATVYNSFPLNECPAGLWSALDPQAIATENAAAAALLNGPRYWLMNAIEKTPEGPRITKTFGGIEMLQQATVLLSSMNPAPYSVNEVSRHTVFVFNAGEQVYELIDPEGQRWVMQSWSQVCRPPTCPSRPARPGRPGSTCRREPTYQPRVLTSELRIDTTTRAAHVTQDDLTNSYSLEV